MYQHNSIITLGTRTRDKNYSWVGHTYQLRAETANLKTRLRATPDFVTFWPPLRAHEGASKMQSLRRAIVGSQRTCTGSSSSAGAALVRSLSVAPFLDDGLEEDGAGRKEAAGRAVAVRGPTGTFEHDAMQLCSGCLSCIGRQLVMLTKRNSRGTVSLRIRGQQPGEGIWEARARPKLRRQQHGWRWRQPATSAICNCRRRRRAGRQRARRRRRRRRGRACGRSRRPCNAMSAALGRHQRRHAGVRCTIFG